MSSVKIDIDYLKMLFEQSTDMVFYMRKSGDDYIYEYINQMAACTVPNIGIDKTVAEVMDFKLGDMIVKNYDEAVNTGKQTQFQDYTIYTSDIRKYETSIYPTEVDGDLYILAITKLIAFDRNLEDKYLFMRSVFFNTFLSTVLLSAQHELLEANPSFLTDFGVGMDDIRGKKLHEIGLIEPRFKQKYLQYMDQAISGELIASKHIQFKDVLGETRHFIVSFSPLPNESEEVIAVFLILQETTDFVKQKEELRTVSHTMDILKRALSATADITITDVNGFIIDVNDNFLNRCGFTRDELIGQTHRVLNSGFHPRAFFIDLWETISSGNVWRGEVCNKSKSGDIYWNESTVIPLRDVAGNITQFLGIYFNVSKKKELMTELRMIERTFRLITENTNDLIVIVNGHGQITYASPSYIRLFGIEEQMLLGMHYEQLLANGSKNNWTTILSDKHANDNVLELELVLPNGERIWTECHYKTSFNGSNYSNNETTMVSRIITERKNYEEQLMFMAYHDNLTHLPNRRFLEKEFPHLMEQMNAQFQSIAVIYIDGDNFKSVNDLYGHDVGDDFIRNFGKVLARNIKAEDLVVRMGGDEFVVLLTGLSRQQAIFDVQVEQFFTCIQQQLKIGWTTNGIKFSPTATMGVSMYPNHSLDQVILIDLADQMLFEAKAAQRNSYKIY